jgi:hypothetical protein
MRKIVVLLSIYLVLSASASAQSSQSSGNQGPGLMPGDFFYPVESFVEDIEVAVAGLIGGPEFKAKAIANNANETLREVQKLAGKNNTKKTSEMIEKYSKSLNQSKKIAERSGDKGLSDRIDQISEKNVKVLEEVKKKVPKEAQEGIEKAIQNSKSKKRGEAGDHEVKDLATGREKSAPEKSFNTSKKAENGKNTMNKTGKILENSSANQTPEKKLEDGKEGKYLQGSGGKEPDINPSSGKEEESSGSEEGDGEKPSDLFGKGPL